MLLNVRSRLVAFALGCSIMVVPTELFFFNLLEQQSVMVQHDKQRCSLSGCPRRALLGGWSASLLPSSVPTVEV